MLTTVALSTAALLVRLCGRLGIMTAALSILAAAGLAVFRHAFAARLSFAVTRAHLGISAALAICAALSILAAVHGFAVFCHVFAACTRLRVSGRSGRSGCGLGHQREGHDQHHYEYEDFRFHNFLSVSLFRWAAMRGVAVVRATERTTHVVVRGLNTQVGLEFGHRALVAQPIEEKCSGSLHLSDLISPPSFGL
jgi:hypothetical protein